MLDWASALVVSTSEFEVAWERLGLGETPWQLDPPRRGPTPAERRAVVAHALDALRQRGVGHSGASPLAGHLRRLAQPHWSVDLRYHVGSLVTAVVAVRDRAATLAVRHADEIALLPIHPDHAVATLVDLPGRRRAGAGREIRVAAPVLDAARARAGPHDPRFVTELADRGVPHHDAVMLAEMCRSVHLRGQLGATVSVGDGTRMRRARYVVGFHTTKRGQFQQVRRAGPAGETVTVGPASRERLCTEVRELLAYATR